MPKNAQTLVEYKPGAKLFGDTGTTSWIGELNEVVRDSRAGLGR